MGRIARRWLLGLAVLVAALAALTAGFAAYNRAYDVAFSRCDAVSVAADPARSEFQAKWLPPRFECVLYDEDGSEARRERV